MDWRDAHPPQMDWRKAILHVGHEIEVVTYGKNGEPPWVNVSIECLDCYEVIVDADIELDIEEG